MSWPTAQDYNEAIQSPYLCFSDPELRSGQPTLNHLGLPKPISGAFASVYQMTCGTREWAVRCFLRGFGDHQRRYKAISEHLGRSNLPFMVGFEFLSKGIMIRGTWFPVLKMEWVDGSPFNLFIEKNLRKPSELQSLARQWLKVLGSLIKAEIAHGDLQHGNIMVSRGQIKLIDYDGLYVPALRDFKSHEEGHRNYQHPARSSNDRGLYIDSFPGWVILVSLYALAEDPNLWGLLNGGDECLLFRQEDFDHPNQSKAFQIMYRSQIPQIRALVSYLQSLLKMPLRQIPPVETNNLPGVSPQPVSKPKMPQWLENNRQEHSVAHLPPLPKNTANIKPTKSIGADWLIDHIGVSSTVIPVWNGRAFFPERLVLLSGGFAFLVFTIFGLAGTLPLWSFLLATLPLFGFQIYFLSLRYLALPCHNDQQLAKSDLSNAKAEVTEIENTMGILQGEISLLEKPLKDLHDHYRQISNRHREALGLADLRQKKALNHNDMLNKKAEDQQSTDIKENEFWLQQQNNPLNQEKNELKSREQNELADSLQKLKNQYILKFLAQNTLADSHLLGIGDRLKEGLRAAGFYSALDVTNGDVRRVWGIGDAKARVLGGWAKRVGQNAEKTAPTSLQPANYRQIVEKYLTIQQSLEAKIEENRCQYTAKKQSIINQLAGTRQQLNASRIGLDQDYENEKHAIENQFEKEEENLRERYKKLQQEISVKKKRKELDQQQLSRELFQAKVKVSTKEQEILRYVNLSFILFLRQVTYFWRK